MLLAKEKAVSSESADVEGVVPSSVVVQGGLVVGSAGGEHVRIADGAWGDFGLVGIVDRRSAEDIVWSFTVAESPSYGYRRWRLFRR